MITAGTLIRDFQNGLRPTTAADPQHISHPLDKPHLYQLESIFFFFYFSTSF